MGKPSVWSVQLALVVLMGCANQGDGVDAGDTIEACSATPVTATCAYRGYGTTCPVACSFPSTCSFDVGVTWTGGHCCGGGESYYDCRCVGGTALCTRLGAGERTTPTTFCEFCEGWFRPDVPADDAGTDDVGADEAG